MITEIIFQDGIYLRLVISTEAATGGVLQALGLLLY